MKIGIDISGAAVRAAALDRSGRLITGGSADCAVQPEGVPVPFLPDILGRAPSDPALQNISSMFGISFSRTEGGFAGIRLPSGAVGDPESMLSGLISNVLRQAEASFGQKASSAVIAVPGFYTRAARAAAARAAEAAGIKAERVVSRAYAAAAASAASLVRSGPGLTSAFELSEMGWSFHVVGYEPDMERGLSVEDMLAAAGGDTGMFMLDYGIASKLLGGGSPDIELIRSVRKLRTVLRDSEDAMGVWQGQQFRLGREVVMQTAAELFRNHLEIIRKRMRTFGIGLVRETASAEIGGYTALPGVINIYCGEPMMKARGAEYDSLYGAALLCLHGSIAGAEAFPYGLTGEVLLRPAAPSGYGSIPRRMAARSVPVKIVQKCAGLLQSRPVRFEIPSGMAPYGLALSENGMPLGRFGFGRSTGASDRPVSGEVSAKPAGADNAVLAEVRVPELGLDITAEVSPLSDPGQETRQAEAESGSAPSGDAPGSASSASGAAPDGQKQAAGADGQGKEQNKTQGEAGEDPEMVSRSRMEREIEKARDFAVTSFAKSLLAPLDAMEASLAHMGDDPALAAYRDGTIQIYRLFLKAFSDNGLVQIDPEKGSVFDPNTEEAIASVGGGDGSEIIIETKAKGYSLNGRCIRYAKVIVGSGGTEGGS